VAKKNSSRESQRGARDFSYRKQQQNRGKKGLESDTQLIILGIERVPAVTGGVVLKKKKCGGDGTARNVVKRKFASPARGGGREKTISREKIGGSGGGEGLQIFERRLLLREKGSPNRGRGTLPVTWVAGN